MTLKQAVRKVRRLFPYAVAGYNAREGVSGFEVRKNPKGEPIVWGQRDEDSAWLAAAEKVSRQSGNKL